MLTLPRGCGVCIYMWCGVLQVEQEGTAEENAFRSSYLNLVDLAGSERTKDTGAAGAPAVL